MVTSFDLHKLGWYEFQELSRIVLREVLGHTVAGFAHGNDGGRDAAFQGTGQVFEGDVLSGHFVAQCKHTSKPSQTLPYSALESDLEKARALAEQGICDVYLLMTNALLTGNTERRVRENLKANGVDEFRLLDSQWFDETISSNSELRMRVPKLYGLGDLTQILNARAQQQADAILRYYATDLKKLVRTGTYATAAKALQMHSFVLLSGEPMTGKTTIATQLSLAAADVYGMRVIVLDRASEVRDYWNPDDPVLFWLDDAFGETQFNSDLAAEWQRAVPSVKTAIAGGNRFILTSRSYVLQRARSRFKAGLFPLIDEAEVVVDVAQLTPTERRQVLYGHLKHGDQPRHVLAAMLPHLEQLADHPDFAPELAKRLGNAFFTKSMRRIDGEALDEFFANPSALMKEIVEGLDTESKCALGLVFLNRGWLPSPIEPDAAAEELMKRMGGSLAGIGDALRALDGSLVSLTVREGRNGWAFTHPTMAEAFSELLKDSEFLHLVVDLLSPGALLDRTTCGDIGMKNALIIPEPLWPNVMERLHSTPTGFANWRQVHRRDSYLASYCCPDFLRQYFDRHPDALEALKKPGLMLEGAAKNEIALRLHEFGLLPEPIRREFVSGVIDFCIDGEDFSVMWNDRFGGMLTQEETDLLWHRLRNETFRNPREVVRTFLEGYDGQDEPEAFADDLERFATAISSSMPEDAEAQEFAASIHQLRWDFIRNADYDWDSGDTDQNGFEAGHAHDGVSVDGTGVGMFEDLLEAR